MKKLFFLTSLLFSLFANASKARIQALSNSLHLIDAQTIFDKPIHLTYLDNLLSLETGLTDATTKTNGSEGIALYSLNEFQRIAIAIGHQDESVITTRNLINDITGSTYEALQNSIHLFYSSEDGSTPYAFGLLYSNKNDKLASLKESSFGLSLGLEIGRFQIQTKYVPINTVDGIANKKFNGNHYLKASLAYLLDQTIFELSYSTSKAKQTTEVAHISTDNELHVQDVVILGLADSERKLENNFFWGMEFIFTTINCKINLSAGCDKKFISTALPVWFGVEIQASDWLTLRSSIKQSFLVNITKDEFGYSSTASNKANGALSDFQAGTTDTHVNAGLGFRFKNISLDGVLSSSTTQKLDFNNFLSQMSLSYAY